MEKKFVKLLVTVFLIAVLCFVLSFLTEKFYVASFIPRIHRGATGGVLYSGDSLVEDYIGAVSDYIELYGLNDVSLPESLDEVVVVWDEEDEVYRCFLYYPLNSQRLIYRLPDGNTMEYIDGWLITPDYWLFDLNTTDVWERLLDDSEMTGHRDERVAAGLFLSIEWPKNPIGYSENIMRSLRQNHYAKPAVFIAKYGIDKRAIDAIYIGVAGLGAIFGIIGLLLCVITIRYRTRNIK